MVQILNLAPEPTQGLAQLESALSEMKMTTEEAGAVTELVKEHVTEKMLHSLSDLIVLSAGEGGLYRDQWSVEAKGRMRRMAREVGLATTNCQTHSTIAIDSDYAWSRSREL